MATEASLAEQTTDGQVEEKKVIEDTQNLGVIEDTQNLEGVNACQDKETGGIGESEEPKVEQPMSPEISAAYAIKAIEDEKGETCTAEGVTKEYEDDKAPASGVLEDKKDDAPVVGDVEEDNEDMKASSSEISMNSKDNMNVVENVKEKAETVMMTCSVVPEGENSKADEEDNTKVTTESLNEAVENQVAEPEISSVQVLEQVGQESEVSEPVIEIPKATEELSDTTADPSLASEANDGKAPTADEPASDTTGELEKKVEIHEASEVLDAPKDEKMSTNGDEVPYEVSKEERDVKESGNTSASQSLDVNAVSEKIKEANDDNYADGCKGETKNEGSELKANESLVKELTGDPNLSTSTVASEAEPIDNNLVSEAAESVVESEIKIKSQEEATLETESVEEQNEEKTAETEPAEEQKGEKTLQTLLLEQQKGDNNVETEAVEEQNEEKTLETNSTLIAADEAGNLSNPADEVAKTYIEEEKNSAGVDKVAEEQMSFDGSDPAIKTTEIPSEKEEASESAEEPKDESVTDNTTLVHTSRGIDPEEQKDVLDTSIKEPVDKLESTEKIHMEDVEKDETEDKKDEAEEIDTQKLLKSSDDSASSKADVQPQKTETPTKPKTLMSKLKRSIVKVKKAIIGTSPSSKTISVNSKDVPEVR